MYDPKFEKAIQQKMEELEFRPPEAVWVNIEKAVVDKRRRRTGFMWRYLLPAILVVAAAGIYYGHYAGQKTANQAHPAAANHPATDASISTATAGASRSTVATQAGADNSSASRGSLDGDAGNSGLAKSGSTNGRVSPRDLAGRTTTGHGRNIRSNQRQTMPGGLSTDVNGTSYAEYSAAAGTTTTEQTGTAEQITTAGQPTTAGQIGTAGQTTTTAQAAVEQKGLSAWFYRPGLADQRMTPQVHGSALNTKKSNLAALAGLSNPLRHWEAGFVAGGGLSRLNRLNSDQAKAALASSATSLYTIAGSSSSKHYISEVRPEASFEGGIYLQRALSDRWIFNTGMNLHYYSTRISVGQQVTTYVQSAASYVIPTTSPSANYQSMYSAGNSQSFTNKYYFLELPVGLQWRLNKSHLLPIFVEGGFSLSRLMGADALFYDAKTGLYTKDGNIVNKTQFTVSSALLVGLPFHGINIQVGPQIQYGLTPLVNMQGLGDQHFLYTGIRLVIIPGRK